MIRVAICEDNPHMLELINGFLNNMGTADTDAFESGDALLRCLEAGGEPYNIYLLDIAMPGRNGIETASAIRRMDKDALLIFVTDHKEYVYEVFEVLPFRFLRKPVEQEDIYRVLQDAEEHINAAKRIFFFHVGHERRQLPCGEIRYFEGAGRRVIIHTCNEDIACYEKISEVPDQVDTTRFVRVHASFVVNLEYVQTVRQNEVILNDGMPLPVSRKHGAALRKAHLTFMQRRGGMSSW